MPSHHIIVTGINHRTASLSKRSRYAWDRKAQTHISNRLRQIESITQFFILTTCNRTEITCISSEYSPAICRDLKNLIPEIETYQYLNFSAIRHILRTLCGLDSMLVGETEILGQYKIAARSTQTKNKQSLTRIIHKLINTAKQVRQTSQLQAQAINITKPVIRNIKSIIGDIQKCRFLCIGSGTVIHQHLQHLSQLNNLPITVACRSPKQFKNTASIAFVKLSSSDNLLQLIKQHDCIISATSAKGFIINRKMLEQIDLRDKLFIDLAVPCDIEPIPEDKKLRRIHLDDLENTNAPTLAIHNAQQQCDVLTNKCFEAFYLDQFTDQIKLFRSRWFHDAEAISKQNRSQHASLYLELKNHMQAICRQMNITAKLPNPPLDSGKTAVNRYIKQLAHHPTLIIKETIRKDCSLDFKNTQPHENNIRSSEHLINPVLQQSLAE